MDNLQALYRHGVRAALGCLMMVTAAAAQITTGSLAGTVHDSQGLGVPGATVILISEARGTRSAPAISSEAGDFVIAGILPDTYTVEVTMPGFKTSTRSGVAVSGGERVSIGTLTLEVGGTTETVDVTSEAPLIQAQSGERSFTVPTIAVQELPLFSRNFANLAQLTPGADFDSNSRLGGGGQNNLMIDGISSMDTGNNGQMLQLNVDAIAEVKVLTSGYQAEFGRSSGLQISAVTKTGTNRFHGSVYDVLRNSDWNSISWEDEQNGDPKNVSEEQDWGFTLGGPIGRPGGDNKLFFFYSMEFRPRTQGGATQRYRLPTALEKMGDFSQSLDNNGAPIPQLRDPLTGQPFAGNIIPTSRIYPVGQAILNWWPIEPNLQQQPGTSYNTEYVRPVTDELEYQPALTMDYQATPNLRFSGRYTGHNQQAINVIRPGTIPGWNDEYRFHGRPWRITYSGSVNYTFNPTTFLEATYGVAQNTLGNPPAGSAANRINSGLGDLPLLFPDAGTVDPRYYNYKALEDKGLPIFVNGQIQVAPNFTWGNLIGSAPPSLLYPGFLNINRTQDLNVSLTKVQGRHTIKGGFYLNHSYKAQNLSAGGGSRFEGVLNFGNSTDNPLDSGFGFANALLGVFTEYSQASKFIEGSYIYNNVEWFVQDNWKVNSRLTLDYGVRFVNQQPQYDQYSQGSNFFVDQWSAAAAPRHYRPGCATGVYPCSNAQRVALDPVSGQLLGPGSAVVIGQVVPNSGDPLNGIVPTGVAPNNKYNYQWPSLAVAPRFGAAYDISGNQRLIVRGGAGLFFDRPDGNSVFAQAGNPPSSTSTSVRYGLLQNLGGGGLLTSESVPRLVVYEFDNTDSLPSSVQWNGGVQMALPFSTSLDVSYVGQHSYERMQNINLNAVDYGTGYLDEYQDPTRAASSTPGATALQTNLLRPYPGIEEIRQNTQMFYRTYHSIQMSANRRFTGGLSAGFNYTLSLSDKGNEGVEQRLEHFPDGSWALRADQDEFNELNENQGLQRHIMKANFVWDLPDVRAGGRVLGAVLNDWQLSGIWTGATGDPFAPTFSYQSGGTALNLTGSPDYNARIVLSGDPGSGCSGNQYRMYNTSVFSGPSYGSVGLESGRNIMNECFQNLWDMAVSRNFQLGGGRTIQVRAEMFNAFNAVIYDDFEDTLQLVSPTNQTIRNPQFNADGTLNQDRLKPNNAGFGAAQGAENMRSVQLQVRFRF